MSENLWNFPQRAPRPLGRRGFLKGLASASGLGLTAVSTTRLAGNVYGLERELGPESSTVQANDRIRFATIGMGIIGFEDTDTALKIPGAEFVAAADVYAGRRQRVREVYGANIDLTVDYRELLERDDIDAILVCTPDHWHATMAIDAMRAGKAVYCEKPMTWSVEEGQQVIDAQRATGSTFQVGSQYASSILYEKVRELVQAGAIGKLNSIEARYNRNSPIGAWQYSIPTDASPQTLDWDRFLGSAPQRSFDAVRAFRWRNYRDYGTAVAGDLFVHLLTGIHVVTGSLGPERIAAMGGLRYWDDGRDVYDFIMGLFDYPKTDAHPGFTLALQCNFEDGGGANQLFRFVGSDGVISVGYNDFTLTRVGIEGHTDRQVLEGYNSVRTFAASEQEAYAKWYRAERPLQAPKPQIDYPEMEEYVVPKGYDPRVDHFAHFFDAIRNGTPVFEDAVFGQRAAAPALLSNTSYYEGRICRWDPNGLKVVG